MNAISSRPLNILRASIASPKSLTLKAVLAAGVLLAPVEAFCQGAPPSASASDSEISSSVSKFWSSQRLLNAKPIELIPAPGHKLQSLAPDAASGQSDSKIGAGAAPTTQDPGALSRRLHQDVTLSSPGEVGTQSEAIEPMNTSSKGAYFTTSRVFPDAATTAYPYVAAGRLVFHNPVSGKDSICSASVLRPRVVVTAGHCVYHAGPTTDDPSTRRYFYNNFLFIPAYNNGLAPKGTWSWAYAIVSGYWSTGGGAVPNTQDIAMLEMRDNSGQKISAFTGYLGYQTGGLSPNHLTIVGYPCNIDNCAKMQNTTAQSFASGGSNTVVYGSAQRGGTSGGPWVQDFGVAGSGAPAGTALNRLKSVSSYGPIATEPKYLGGSILLSSGVSSFIDILNRVCAHRAGNC